LQYATTNVLFSLIKGRRKGVKTQEKSAIYEGLTSKGKKGKKTLKAG
jgi:hypothetical protein